MRSFRLRRLLIGFACFLLLAPAAVSAQSPGTRAAGMGEAFVAVADDATSIYWNPAGMATGALLSLVLDVGAGDATPDDLDLGSKRRSRFIGFTVPPLGLGYYRLQRVVADVAGSAGTGERSREEGGRSVLGLTTANVGVTLAQSLNEFVVVAGTFKYVRGTVTSGVAYGTAAAALDAAGGMAERDTSRFDVDAGAMVALANWRLGLSARNLTTPEFERPEAGADPLELEREVRGGVAWGSGWPGISRLVVSADADLTRKQAFSGERRDVAAGIETWWLQQRLGLRAGLRGSTIGETRTVLAGGVSAAVKPGVFVEAHLAGGDQDERTWSVGARVTF